MTQINSGAGVTARLAFFVIFHFTSLFLLTKVFSESQENLVYLDLVKMAGNTVFCLHGDKICL